MTHPATTPPTRRRRPREDGIALLLTLGVLSLLIVLAFSFALAAINSQIASKLDEGLLKARLQAESSLQMVYGQLGKDFAVKSDPGNLFPATALGKGATPGPADTPFEGRYYWYSTSSEDTHGIDEALHVSFGGVDFLAPGFSTVDSDVGWIHVLHSETADRIVARYAYVIIDESGKIDPSTAISASAAEGSEGTRQGISTAEVNLNHVLSDSALVTDLQYEAQGGQLPDDLRWLSHFHLLQGTTQAVGSNSNTREILANLFPHSYDIESYHDSPLDKHRFDMARTAAQWDALTIADLDTGAENYWAVEGATTTANVGGIPWLHYGDVNKKYQIMANLLDYCDSDSLPRSDYVDAPTPLATYVGLEEVPFINEFVVTMSLTASTTTAGNYEWRTDLQAELINMWPVNYNLENCTLQAAITIDYVVDEVPETTQFVYTFQIAGPTFTDLIAESNSYYDFEALAIGAVTDIGPNDEIEITDMVIDYAVLKNPDGVALDYVGQSQPVSSFGAGVRINIPDNFKAINIEVDDPRANLRADGWAWAATWVNGFGGTLGLRNANCQPAVVSDPDNDGVLDKDHEPLAIEPWDVSTAYIRNAPMQALWELGTIHRDSPWETINLKQHDDGSNTTSGFGSYVQGDANILDQVKMGDRLREVGRININTYNTAVLTGLFADIPIASHFDADRSTDTPLAKSSAGILAAKVAQESSQRQGGAPFTRRSQVVNVGGFSEHLEGTNAGDFYTSDAAMESLIGKSAPLTTIRQNYFTLIVVAQIIDDVGAVNLSGNEEAVINGIPAQLMRFDPGADKVVAQQRIMAIIYRDALNATHYRLERYQYLE